MFLLTLSHLKVDWGHRVCSEWFRLDFKLGRADNEVAVGDTVEMLLSISFACKDAMLDWLGIDMEVWPHQRLDWEMYRIEYLA